MLKQAKREKNSPARSTFSRALSAKGAEFFLGNKKQ